MRIGRYLGVRGQELVDLDSGEPFLPDDPAALDPYFERSHGQTILRIEYDTRVFLMPGHSQQFPLAWLQRRHPGYEGYRAYMLRRRSPEPSTLERSPASAVLIAELR